MLKQIKIKSIFHYTRCITPKRVTILRGSSPRHYARATQIFLEKCRRSGASRWQHCVRFDRQEIRISDLPLQRQTRYARPNELQINSCGAADNVASNTSVSCNTG